MGDRKFSTSIQLSERQFDILGKITQTITQTKKVRISNSEVIRDAFDLYVSMNFPQFINK